MFSPIQATTLSFLQNRLSKKKQVKILKLKSFFDSIQILLRKRRDVVSLVCIGWVVHWHICIAKWHLCPVCPVTPILFALEVQTSKYCRWNLFSFPLISQSIQHRNIMIKRVFFTANATEYSHFVIGLYWDMKCEGVNARPSWFFKCLWNEPSANRNRSTFSDINWATLEKPLDQ